MGFSVLKVVENCWKYNGFHLQPRSFNLAYGQSNLRKSNMRLSAERDQRREQFLGKTRSHCTGITSALVIKQSVSLVRISPLLGKYSMRRNHKGLCLVQYLYEATNLSKWTRKHGMFHCVFRLVLVANLTRTRNKPFFWLVNVCSLLALPSLYEGVQTSYESEWTSYKSK